LRDLIAHTSSHFSREERLMRSMRYPSYAWHKGQHDTVRAKVARLQRCVERGDREAVLPALDFLTAWLQTHTAVSDRMMGAFVRTQGYGLGREATKSRLVKSRCQPRYKTTAVSPVL
jgi:hemerythrin-like metal-binding protein